MIPVEYFVAIDFGTANTKVLCWDINEKDIDKNIFPLRLGDGLEDGLIPTVFEDSESQIININFFDTPSRMQILGDNDTFTYFVKELFDKIIDNNKSTLFFDEEKEDCNFLVVISYPEMWEEKDGASLLALVQKNIPPARYAIKAEYNAFAEKYLRNKKSEEEKWLVGEINSCRFACLTTRPCDNVSFFYSVYEQSIELYMLERAISLVELKDYNNLDKELIHLIEQNRIPEAEYNLRKKKELLLLERKSEKPKGDSIYDKMLDEALMKFCTDFENALRTFKNNNFIPNNIFLIENINNSLLDSVVRKVYPHAEIMYENTFGLCRGVLQYFQVLYCESNKCYSDFKNDLLDTSNKSVFLTESCKYVSSLFSEICITYDEKFKNDYVLHPSKTSYNDFAESLVSFFENDLPIHFDKLFTERLGRGHLDICNKIAQSVMSPDDTNIYNDIGNYFHLTILPCKYSCDYLRYRFVSEVFNKMYRIWDADMAAERKIKDREKAYNEIMKYFSNTQLVNDIPKISWTLLTESEIIRLYMLDTYLMNLNLLVSANVNKTASIDLLVIQSVINYAINKIIEEYFEGLYQLNNDKWTFNSNSQVQFWKTFDFSTYLLIKNQIGKQFVELNTGKLEESTNIKKDYPILFSMLKSFFGFDTPSELEYGDPEVVHFSLSDLYRILVSNFLSYRNSYNINFLYEQSRQQTAREE